MIFKNYILKHLLHLDKSVLNAKKGTDVRNKSNLYLK